MTHQIFNPETIVTSFTWYPYGATDERYCPLLAATLSTGEIYLVQFPDREFSDFMILNDGDPINVHGLEGRVIPEMSSIPVEMMQLFDE